MHLAPDGGAAMSAQRLARRLIALLLLCAPACDDRGPCPPDESFVVEEVGTCAATPTQLTVTTHGCRITLQDSAGSGLPQVGAMGQPPKPVRQGGFILYTLDPAPFRL